jgi:peptide/nickel transport system permease protein
MSASMLPPESLTPTTTEPGPTQPAGTGRLRTLVRRLTANKVTAAALLVVLALLALAVLAPLIAPYGPTNVDLGSRLQPLSSAHLFGTDEVGRDILSRLIYGARISIGVSLLTVAVAAVVGMLLGALAGYLGRWTDHVIMRAVDVVLSFPSLILAIALAAALGPSLVNAAIAIAIVKIPAYARLAYAETLGTRQQLYVRAARTYGIGSGWIIRRHILPNIRSSVLVQTTLDLGDVILLIATLGFLGLGAQPPSPEWGSMISTGWHYLIDQWWYPTFTGAAIFITVMSFNLLGDGVSDLLDPTSRD